MRWQDVIRGDRLARERRTRSQSLRARLERTEREAAARQRQLERYAADLREVFKQERARAQELRRSYRATVRALSNAVEARDAYTGKHAERVTAYGMELARAVGSRRRGVAADRVRLPAARHRQGRGARTRSCSRPSTLTEEEYALIAQHPVVGAEILRDVDFLGEGKLVVRHHHERWDGTGYPDGLARRRDPARRARVRRRRHARRADHRPPLPPGVGLGATRATRSARVAGTQFDPAVVAAFDDDPRRRRSRACGTACAVTRTILIVDDDPMIRKLIATTLEDVSGYRLQEAGDGLEAVERARRRAARRSSSSTSTCRG